MRNKTGTTKSNRAMRESEDERKNSELEDLIESRRFFPDKAAAEAAKIADRLTPETVERELAKGRRDLRGLEIVTIDGEDTRDVDDGVSLVRIGGGWELGVHIADVAHYVKPGSAVDREAYRRGTSVYFPDAVLPMLPAELSNGICSLNVGEDRLALTVMMRTDTDGNIVSHEIFESVINVKYKITYDEYYRLFEGDAETRGKLAAIFADHATSLAEMRRLAELRRRIRVSRGMLDFELPETKVSIGKNGRPDGVYPYRITFANGVIEEFMIAANETVAAHFSLPGMPFIYRNHPGPDKEKLAELDGAVRLFGFRLTDRKGGLIEGAIADMLEKSAGTGAGPLIQKLTLASMGKAVYSAVCDGHFALASGKYTHFTSPIRRYPDLYIHRVIKESLYGARPETLASRYPDSATVAAGCSEAEREAEKAERFYTDKMVAAYMAGFQGEDFVGTVSGMTSFGLFITLGNSAEGLLFYSDMPDRMIFDPRRLIAKGQRTGRKYRLGDTVEVRLAAADEKTGRIQFLFA